MRYKVLIPLAIALLVSLTGCTSKEEYRLMQVYEKKRQYHKQLQKTEKIQLYDGDITKVVLTATYLNKQVLDKKRKPHEVFLVSIHTEEGEEVLFETGAYTLMLNQKPPKAIQKLKADDALLKDLSFASEWNHFYRVTFPHTSSKKLKLRLKSEAYGKGVMHFAKVAKYLLTQKVF